jgi:putative phosphoesterase
VRVVVVGDTHLPRFGRQLPSALIDGLRAADLVLHCGDLIDAFVLELLDDYAPTIAVAGNNDGPELNARLGQACVIELEEAVVGLTHGHMGKGRTTVDRAMRMFGEAEPPLDAICFGHSHIPTVERRGHTWLLNPGSPTDKRRQPTYSYLVLEVSGGVITPELVRFESRA